MEVAQAAAAAVVGATAAAKAEAEAPALAPGFDQATRLQPLPLSALQSMPPPWQTGSVASA